MPGRPPVRCLLPVLASLLLVGASHAQEMQPRGIQPDAPAGRSRAPAPDPALEAARTAFEALPEADRRAIQDALVWTGDYNAVTAGTFGPRTFQAIAAWQKRSGAASDGLLTRSQRTALDAAGSREREAARFKPRVDAASGAMIGVPEGRLTRITPQPGGTRWQSADARITLDTRSFKPGETDLDTLFERASAPGPERKITYKLRKPDFIVVTAETASGRSFVRYALGAEGIRGFAIGYDKAMAAEVDRLVIAIANSFEPFPQAQKPAVGPAAPPVASASPPPEVAPVATGLVVAPNRVVTASSALEGCATPFLAGRPAQAVKRDGTDGLALITVDLAGSLQPYAAAIRADAPKLDEPVVVLAATMPRGTGAAAPSNAPTIAPGVATAHGLAAALQPGAGGAPFLDRSGRIAGLVARYPTAVRRVAGVVPPATYDAIPGGTLDAFLRDAGIVQRTADADPSVQHSTGSAAQPYLRSVVAINCSR